MVNFHQIQKLSVIVVSGLFFGTSLLPFINAAGFSVTEPENESIPLDIATRVANAKLHEQHKTNFFITQSTQITNEKEEPLFYVFNLQPPGYLIVTGSYDLPPVIAYSFTSDFKDYTDGNPLFDLVYADLKVRLENIEVVSEKIVEERHLQWDSYIKGIPLPNKEFEQWPPEGSTPTGGWLTTNWHQSAPYNNFCPLDIAHGGSRSVAGCPAVTIAQILNYHNTTMNVQFDDSDDYYHNYGGNQFWIDNNYVTYGFKSFPELNTYLSALQSHYDDQIAPTSDDKAAITFACGVAATQVYGASGSGTFGVSQAYAAYQRFNCNTISLLDDDDPDLYQRLSSNIKDALPAHLAIVNEAWTSGHNVVVDGYNTNNYYHVNFGWGGSYNGWYLIPDEMPYSLTVIEGVIVDILDDDLTGDGTLEWTNVIPNEMVSDSFTVSNIGDPGSNLNWVVSQWPSWGSWTFTPPNGKDLRPEEGAFEITANVVVPNQEHQNFSGEIRIENLKNRSDFSTISVTLTTGKKIHEKLSCSGSLSWIDVKPKATVTGSFTVENIGAAFSNLSWEIIDWPDWGNWTFTPTEGTNLTPEYGSITINVQVIAPEKKRTEFSGIITVVNRQNSSDFDTIPVSLATPYQIHLTLFEILQMVMERYPHAFPLLRVLLNR